MRLLARDRLTRGGTVLLAGLVLTWPLAVLAGVPAWATAEPRQAFRVGLLMLGGLALGRVPTASRIATGVLIPATLVLPAIVLGLPLPLPSDLSHARLLAGGVGLGAAAGLLLGVLVPVLRGQSSPPLMVRPMAGAIGMYVALLLAGPGLGRLALGLLPGVAPETSSAGVVASLSVELAMLLCLGSLGGSIAPLGWRALGFIRLPPGRIVLVGLVAVLATSLADTVVGLAFESLGLDRAHLGNVRPLAPGLEPPGFAQAVVTDALLPGSTEELFFRGALFGGMVRARVPLWLALVLSSGLFALAHLEPTMLPLQLAHVSAVIFLNGCVLAVTYHQTGSLYPGMLAHALSNLPATMGLTLPDDVPLQATSLLLSAGTLALVVLLTERRQPSAPVHLTSILRRLNPRVDLGRVEVRPATHLVALAVVGLLAPRGLNALAFALGVYGLVQGSAIASRGPRTVAAVRCGRQVRSARLAPLLVVRLSEDDPWWARRWTAAAGTAGLAVYGLGLLAARAWLGGAWAPEVQELVVQVGWLSTLASLAEALPVQLPEGHTEDVLWAHPWQPRPPWLAFLPMLLVVSIAAGLVMRQFPVGYTRHTLEPVLGQPMSLVGAVLVLLAAPVAAARVAAKRRTMESPS